MQDFATLKGLVEHYSPTGSETAAVEWLLDRMRALGYTRTFRDKAGNAVGILGDGPAQIVLLGHIDTVPGEIPMRVENGILHGRGSVDAKGPLAAFTDAAGRAGAAPGWQIVVIGAVDEEGDSKGAWFAAGEYRPTFAFIGEPSGWDRVTLGYKGIVNYRFTARRPIGHTASGDDSAPERVMLFWNRLAEICARENDGRERKFDQVTPVLRRIHSEDDAFMDTAWLWGNARLPERTPPDAMKVLLEEAAQDIPGGEVVVSGRSIAACRVEKSTPVVGALLAGIRARQGAPTFSYKLGTADLNVVAPAWKCPMAVYGPGDSTLDHTPKECIELAEYGRAVDILEYAIRRLTRKS